MGSVILQNRVERVVIHRQICGFLIGKLMGFVRGAKIGKQAVYDCHKERSVA